MSSASQPRCGSRSASRWLQAWVEEARMPQRRSAWRTRSSTSLSARGRCTGSRLGSALMFRSSCEKARSSVLAVAQLFLSSRSRRITGSCWFFRRVHGRSRRRPCTTRSTGRRGSRADAEALLAALEARDLAALPSNDLALVSDRARTSPRGARSGQTFPERGRSSTASSPSDERAVEARELMASHGATWLAQPAW